MSPFWILLEQQLMEAVVTTAAIRRTKLQIVTTNNLLTGLMPFLLPNQQCQSSEGKMLATT